MKPYSILIIIDLPAVSGFDASTRHASAVAKILGLAQQNKSIRQLSHNVLLLRIDDQLRALQTLLTSMDEVFENGTVYKYSIFQEEIEWRECKTESPNNRHRHKL